MKAVLHFIYLRIRDHCVSFHILFLLKTVRITLASYWVSTFLHFIHVSSKPFAEPANINSNYDFTILNNRNNSPSYCTIDTNHKDTASQTRKQLLQTCSDKIRNTFLITTALNLSKCDMNSDLMYSVDEKETASSKTSRFYMGKAKWFGPSQQSDKNIAIGARWKILLCFYYVQPKNR